MAFSQHKQALNQAKKATSNFKKIDENVLKELHQFFIRMLVNRCIFRNLYILKIDKWGVYKLKLMQKKHIVIGLQPYYSSRSQNGNKNDGQSMLFSVSPQNSSQNFEDILFFEKLKSPKPTSSNDFDSNEIGGNTDQFIFYSSLLQEQGLQMVEEIKDKPNSKTSARKNKKNRARQQKDPEYIPLRRRKKDTHHNFREYIRRRIVNHLNTKLKTKTLRSTFNLNSEEKTKMQQQLQFIKYKFTPNKKEYTNLFKKQEFQPMLLEMFGNQSIVRKINTRNWSQERKSWYIAATKQMEQQLREASRLVILQNPQSEENINDRAQFGL